MGNPVVHFEIRAEDPDRQKSFYAELFGWEMSPETNPLRYAMVDTKAEAGIRGGVREAAPGPRGLTFYVQVESLDEALVRAQRPNLRSVSRLAGNPAERIVFLIPLVGPHNWPAPGLPAVAFEFGGPPSTPPGRASPPSRRDHFCWTSRDHSCGISRHP